MNRTEISAKQMEMTVAMFLVGSSLISSGSSEAQQDTWICVLLAFALSVPLVWVHARILELYPGRSYFGNMIQVLGKPAGRTVSVVLLLFTFQLSAFVLRTFAEFIHIVNMPETPLVAISACVTAVAVYVLENRLHVLARICKFTLPLLIATLGVTIALSAPSMELDHLKPVLHSGWSHIAYGTLTYFSMTYGELIVCAPMFCELDRKEKVFPVFLRGALWGFLILFGADLRNLLILGYSSGVFLFPSFEAVSVVALGDFFTRIEVLIGINLLMAGFLKNCVMLTTVCIGIAKTFGYRDYEPFVAPCALLIMALSEIVQDNTEQLFQWIRYFSYFSIPFQVLLPVLVLIVGTVRKRRRRPPGKEAEAPRPQAPAAE